MPSLGLDIGGSSIKAALLADSGHVTWEGASPRYARPTRDQLLDALRAALAPCPTNNVSRIGLCVPGILNADRTAIEKSVNLPSLVGVPLIDLARAALASNSPPDLTLTSDAHAAAYDIWSAERLTGRLLALSLGTGVGACVLDDGLPLHVSGASPGHIGQIDVSLGTPNDPIGPDGGRGSLEAYIGLRALQQNCSDDPARIFATLTVDHAPLVALARAIRICHAIYRPHHVRLLGGVGVRLARLVPALRDRIAAHLTSVARDGWTLAAGATDFHAARGAARLAMRSP